jgi:PPOX class probable F420-dependent enzyme
LAIPATSGGTLTFPEETVTRILERWPVAHLALLDARGEPRQLPIVFARAGGALWSPVDGKPKRSAELARLRLLERHPRVSLLFDEYAADWSQLWWLELRGQAEVVRADTETDPRIAAAAAALRAKYPQYAATALFQGPPTLIRITAENARGWAAAGVPQLERMSPAPQ